MSVHRAIILYKWWFSYILWFFIQWDLATIILIQQVQDFVILVN